MPNSDDKKSLRKKLRDLRDQVGEHKANIASVDICAGFLNKISLNKNDVVAIYYPVANEVSCLLLAKELNQIGIKVALPLIQKPDSPLVFKEWIAGDKLVFNDRFKIYEPSQDAADVVPNVIITPALAFDEEGYRLGYGGGYYDRTIADLQKSGISFKTVGVGYDFQICEKLPVGEYDKKVDLTILV